MATPKRVKAWKAKLTPGKQYPVDEALKLVKEFATAKFAEAVDAAVNLGIEKGSGTPNSAKVGKISRKQLEEIAKTKQPDLTAADLEAAMRTVAGTARSMGVDVEGT